MVAAMTDDTTFCTYVSVKIDQDVLRLAKAASSLDGKTVQDWLSDLANSAASERLKAKPIKRKPARKDKP